MYIYKSVEGNSDLNHMVKKLDCRVLGKFCNWSAKADSIIMNFINKSGHIDTDDEVLTTENIKYRPNPFN